MANPPEAVRLLWNPENVRDVAESVGIGNLPDDALRTVAQDVEYRIGQVLVESLRMMRMSNRTTLTVQDVTVAMRVLDVEPLYGYDSTRPLRFGEASLGPGQPLFYVEDEEVDFEKLINAPLPKVPRDVTFTAHWLAIEGVQPSIPQNPTTSESRAHDLAPKGAASISAAAAAAAAASTAANPALAALAGSSADPNIAVRPAIKHVISKELVLYFDKIQGALLDDTPDDELSRLRHAALASVRDDPGLHQLVPYFINFIADQVTHHLDDIFVLRQMMELTGALIANRTLFLDPYAGPISAPVLTCLMGRKLGNDDDSADSQREQYQLREFSAALVGQLAKRYAATNTLLRPKLTRTCLKFFLDPTRPAPVLYGAISGLAAAGGPESIRILVLKALRSFDTAVLQPLKERSDSSLDYEMLVAAITKAIASIADRSAIVDADGDIVPEPVTGPITERERADLIEFLGSAVGEKVLSLRNRALVREVLEARYIE